MRMGIKGAMAVMLVACVSVVLADEPAVAAGKPAAAGSEPAVAAGKPAGADGETIAADDMLMRALVDELDRSMKELALEGMPRPYFLQYTAQEQWTFSMGASYGGLLGESDRRYRQFYSRIRVGDRTMDNSNFFGVPGVVGYLPIESDYGAIRQMLWQFTDVDYKRAVEILAQKIAYLQDKNIPDRSDDLSPADVVTHAGELVHATFDRDRWARDLKRLSARFERHPKIQDARVSFLGGTANEWIVNSEGTRLRMGDRGCYLQVDADTQAADGMYLADSRSYLAETPDKLPPMEKVLSDIDGLCQELVTLTEAPILEAYGGPVLFEPKAAATMFDALLAFRLCAQPKPIGNQGWVDESFEKKIGRRVLPAGFQVVDDPSPRYFGETFLAGAFEYDDEAVRASRVTLVEDGVVKTLLASRAPTKAIHRSTGHGRSYGYGDPEANIGCLYISDNDGVAPEKLREMLIEAARDEGLAFGLRIATMEEGGPGWLRNPILAYKVYVDDGREELVRGLEFQEVNVRALKNILAAGREQAVFNSIGGVGTSVIAPAVLFEELDLTREAVEHDKLPILKSPATRE